MPCAFIETAFISMLLLLDLRDRNDLSTGDNIFGPSNAPCSETWNPTINTYQYDGKHWSNKSPYSVCSITRWEPATAIYMVTIVKLILGSFMCSSNSLLVFPSDVFHTILLMQSSKSNYDKWQGDTCDHILTVTLWAILKCYLTPTKKEKEPPLLFECWEDLYQHEVEHDSLTQHPREGCEEEVLDQGCHCLAANLIWKRYTIIPIIMLSVPFSTDLIAGSKLNSKSKHQVSNQQWYGQVEVNKVVDSSKQLFPTLKLQQECCKNNYICSKGFTED